MKGDRLVVLLCGLTTLASSSIFAETRSVNLKTGQKLYQQHCLKCHGARLDGKGPDAASLRMPPVDFHKYLSRVKSDLELEVTIRQGRKLTDMHEWDTLLTDQQIYDLIAYIRRAVPHLEVNP
jgi:cytochrome c oxidase cbb3-type subunit 3